MREKTPYEATFGKYEATFGKVIGVTPPSSWGGGAGVPAVNRTLLCRKSPESHRTLSVFLFWKCSYLVHAGVAQKSEGQSQGNQMQSR